METILDSKVISKYISRKGLASYEADLDKWMSNFGMERFNGSFDHFGIKVEDEQALKEVTEAIKPYCQNKGATPGLSIRAMHGRKITTALLKNPIVFKGQPIDCIEIMQPRPHKERDYEIMGIDHLEIINPRLDEIEAELQNTKASYYVDGTNKYKDIVVSFVNNRNERVKFTNKTLEEIVPTQISDEPGRVEIITI
jgi:predicted metalloenzyme YecM